MHDLKYVNKLEILFIVDYQKICIHAKADAGRAELRCYAVRRRAGHIRNSQENETVEVTLSFSLPALLGAPVYASNRRSGADILLLNLDGSVSF